MLTTHPSVTAVSLHGEVGNQFMVDDTFYVEPIAAYSFANVTGDDAVSAAGVMHLGSNDSLRLSVGGRIGSDIKTEKAIIDLSLTARGWSEVNNRQTASFTIGAATLPVSTRSVGTYGEIIAGMKVMSTDTSLTGYLNGGLQVNGLFTQATISGGLRYAF